MEINNVALEQAAAQRQRTENGAKQGKVGEQTREERGDRLSISSEPGTRAEPGSGRIQDAETAAATAREVIEAMGRDGGLAAAAHSAVSPQMSQLLDAA